MTSDTILYTPGDRVGVEPLADADGVMPTRGQGVELVGESRSYTQVQLTQGADSYGIGHLTTDPDKYDEDTSYAEGDSAGEASVLLNCAVHLLDPADGYSPSVGDMVGWDAGGTVSQEGGPTATSVGTLSNDLGIDGDGNLETLAGADTEVQIAGGLPIGVVFATGTRDFGSADKVAVARYM